MQEVVPALAQELTCGLVQLTLRPLGFPLGVSLFVLLANDTGVVPRREMMNPWQYPPESGFVVLGGTGYFP